MLIAVVVVVVAVLWQRVAAFNLDTSYPLVRTSQQRGSYYGYTVALRDLGAGEQRLVIGAPRGNSSYPNHAKLEEPGVVYQCDMYGGPCQQLALDLSGNIRNNTANKISYRNKKDHGWLGASIAVAHVPRSPMVVCAPRWIDSYYTNFYFMNGMCYWSAASSRPDSNAAVVYPLSGDHRGYVIPPKPGQNKTEVYYYAYGEAGLSIHFTKNYEDLVIGAPGLLEWAGSIVVYRNVLSKHSTLHIPNPFFTSKQETYDYFGYAVSSGKFFTEPLEASGTLYVSGAPRAGELRGKVFVFNLPPAVNHALDIKVEKTGEQVGEYFGASLCVADVNKDGLDDLLVGAPYHALREPGRTGWDEGRVYVFLSQNQGQLKEVTGERKIVGDGVNGGNFGTSIASVGDLDRDGYADIAVGAPYGGEDRRGVIYIYNGNRDGISSKYSQRILGSDINKSIRGFGISISNGMDIDNNNYNDVAVGAYVSGHAVVLRSRPVVDLKAELTADVSRISINATSFQVASCLSFTGQYMPPAIDVHCELVVETFHSIAYFSSDANNETTMLTEVITVSNGISSCKNFTINLKRGKKDFSKPIDIKLDFLLLRLIPVRRKRNAYEDFCKYCPILDPHKPTSAKLRVPFATGCGEEDICRTDIRLLAEIVSSAVPLVLGDQNALAVAIAVENLLDPAFLARVIIEAPHFLVLVRMPSSCRETSSPMLLRLDCDVGNPLNSQIGLRNITVELDVEEIPGNTTELVFNVSGTSAGQEQMPGDNHKLLSLDVRTLSDIRMTGTSSEDMVYFRKAADSEDEEITIVHSYEVRNYGPSKVDSVELMFTVPVAMLLDEKNITFNKLYSPKASLAGQPFPCSARDYDFLRDSSSWTRDAGDELDSGVLESSSRKRRSVDDVSEDDAAPANGTLYLSCEQEQTICATVVCAHVGPFRSVQTSATAQLSMSLQLQQLVTILGKRDVVLLSTYGSIAYQRPANSLRPSTKSSLERMVVTTFKSEAFSKGLELWVLVLAIVAGLLLFLLLVLGLIKLGFFRRSKKEELDILKNEMEVQDDDDDNSNADQAL